MADATLSLVLDANGYLNWVNKATEATKNFEKAAGGAAKAADGVGKAAKDASQKVRHQAAALTQLNDFTQQVAYSGGKLSTVLIAASSQFDQLRSQTGSSAAAFRLLGSAISSPVAIILGGITVLSLFSEELFGTGEAVESLEQKLKNVDEALDANVKSVEVLREKYGKYADTIKEVLKQQVALAKIEAAETFRKESEKLVKGVVQLSYNLKNYGKITQEQADIIVNSWTSLSHAAQTGDIAKFNAVFGSMSNSLAKTGFDATNLDKDMQELWKTILRLAQAGAAVDPFNEATGKGAVENAKKLKETLEESHKAELDFNNALSASDAMVRAENEEYWKRRGEEEAKITEEYTKRNATILEGLMRANELVNSQLSIEEARLAGEQQLVGYYGEQLISKREELEIEKQIAQLRATGKFSEDELKGFQARLKALSDTKREIEEVRRVHDTVMKEMESAIDTFVETGKFKFKDFAASIIKELLRIQLKKQAVGLFGNLFGNIGTALQYGTNIGSQQTAMLAAQWPGGYRGGLVTANSGIQPMRFANGGMVPGSGNRDSVPALLMPGEYVMNKEQVADAKNAKQVQPIVINQNYNITGYTDQQLIAKMKQTISTSTKEVYGASKQGERDVGISSFR